MYMYMQLVLKILAQYYVCRFQLSSTLPNGWKKQLVLSIVIHVVGMKLLHVSYHQKHMKRRSVHLEFTHKACYVYISSSSCSMRRQFKGGQIPRAVSTEIDTHNFNKKPCSCTKCMCTYVYHCRPFTVWQDFEGSIY